MRRAVLGCLAVFGALALAITTFAPAGAATSLETAQYRLQQFGCQPGGVTGKASDRTKYAIVKFQSANALTQTGKLNDITRAKLAKPTAIPCDDRPVPAKTGTGKRIVFSQKQNWIWLVRSDGTVTSQFGVIDNPYMVKPGVHYTGSKCGRPAKILHNRSYDKTLILDHYVRFVACGVGFHRVPTYPSNGRQIHEDYLLGTDAMTSHGCVRMSADAATKLWYFVGSQSTKVFVLADR